MSRIYDALRRAGEEAKRRGVPAASPKPGRPPARIPEPPPSPGGVRAVSPPSPEPEISGSDPDLHLQDIRANDIELEEPATPLLATPDPRTYHDRMRKALQSKLALERKRMLAAGKHPFEGKWLTLREIRALRWRLRLRDLGILLQLVLLILLMGLLALVFQWTLVQFLLPRTS